MNKMNNKYTEMRLQQYRNSEDKRQKTKSYKSSLNSVIFHMDALLFYTI